MTGSVKIFDILGYKIKLRDDAGNVDAERIIKHLEDELNNIPDSAVSGPNEKIILVALKLVADKIGVQQRLFQKLQEIEKKVTAMPLGTDQ